MRNLSIWLPPFSPDYSGAASVLFDFNAVTAMHDAAGCTGNYTGYDEPRWYNSEKNIFCSGLREIDAVLGNDDALIEKILKAAESLQPELLALIGTPVPMLIGCDLKGLARQLENTANIPAIGIQTAGTAYYNMGIFLAWKELIENLADPSMPVCKNCVNIVGANPIDFVRLSNITSLKEMVQQAGFEVNSCGMEPISVETVRRFFRAEINIAVSQAGVLIARYLYKKRGMPYIAGFPIGEKACSDFPEKMLEVCRTKHNYIWNAECKADEQQVQHILCLGDQVFCNALRRALQQEYGIGGIAVGAVFGAEKELLTAGDTALADESEIKVQVNNPVFDTVIGDPFFKKLVKKRETTRFIDLPHFGISSKFHRKDAPHVIGKDGAEMLRSIVREILMV